jgi:integrase
MGKRLEKEYMKTLLVWVSENCPEWEGEPCAVEWLNRLPSERTKANVKREFRYFLGFAKQCPTAMLEQRLKDMGSANPKDRGRYEDLIIDYKNVLAKQGYSKNMIVTLINRAQSFFGAHRVHLKFGRNDLKIDLSAEAKSQRRTKVALNHDQIGAMYKHAEDIETKVAFLLGAQNGLLPADISSLRIEQLPLTEDESAFDYVEIYREKTDVPIKTFISPELKHDVKILLNLRGSPKEGYLFATRGGAMVREDHLSAKVKALGKVVELPDFTTKDLRDYFHQSLENESVPEYHKRELMGHQKMGAEPSYLGGREGLLESYLKVFHKRLSVNGWVQSRKDLSKHEDRLKVLFAALAAENPKKDLINLLEREWGYSENAIWAQITGNAIMDKSGKIRGMRFEEIFKIIIDLLRRPTS